MNILKKIKQLNEKRKLTRQKPQLYLFKDIELGYIQIPKVASSSIRNALTQFLLGRDGIETVLEKGSHFVKAYEQEYAAHLPNKEIAELAKQYFIFAFVRNPFDRVYSCYKNKVRFDSDKKNIFEKNNIPSGISFDEFVARIVDIPDDVADRHFKSQSWFLAYQGKLIPHYIGRLESFAQDWQPLQTRFGIALPSQLNQTAKKELVLSDKTRERIIERYQDDFRLLGYTTDLYSGSV